MKKTQAPDVTVTIQERKNRLGQIAYRAFVLVQDVVVDSWGHTPSEAEEKLKMRLGTMAMKLDKEFAEKVKETLKNAPKSEENKIVHDALKDI